MLLARLSVDIPTAFREVLAAIITPFRPCGTGVAFWRAWPFERRVGWAPGFTVTRSLPYLQVTTASHWLSPASGSA
jgi:hypothetical protein